MWRLRLKFGKCFESWHQRPQNYKLYKKSPGTRIRSEFYSERVITVLNDLPVSTDFSTITRFKGSILNADFSDYFVCF